MRTILLILSLAVGAYDATAQTTAFTYQGHLRHSANWANGLYEMQFTLFDAITNGNPVALPVALAPVAVSNGIFTVALDFGGTPFDGNARWLEISLTVYGTDQPLVALTPRQPITSTPYAIHAATATGLSANGQRILRLAPDPESPNIIGGSSGNYVSPGVAGAFIGGGGTLNDGFGFAHTNRVTGDYGTIGGGFGNSVCGGSFIGGGALNICERADNSVIGGGFGNLIKVDAHSATIAGGLSNVISEFDGTGRFAAIGGGHGNHANGDGAVIGGGRLNQSVGPAATVGGGEENTSTADHATVGGGARNFAGAIYTTIAGGSGNVCSMAGATVGGGAGNTASDEHATVAGGSSNHCSGEYGTIGGGAANLVEGTEATVGGGFGNMITPFGAGATIPGGVRNLADGYYSFAAGSDAHALHDGCFVWADGAFSQVPFAQVRPFPSSTNNEFAVRATGGVRLVSAVDTNGTPTAGVELASGAGAWSNLSDRNAKENFAPINPREVLDKVAALPVATWNYKTQDKSVRHIGPTAQDFHAAFGLGDNDRGITTVDAEGVALAAIQGLNQKVASLEKELAELKEVVQELSKNKE